MALAGSAAANVKLPSSGAGLAPAGGGADGSTQMVAVGPAAQIGAALGAIALFFRRAIH